MSDKPTDTPGRSLFALLVCGYLLCLLLPACLSVTAHRGKFSATRTGQAVCDEAALPKQDVDLGFIQEGQYRPTVTFKFTDGTAVVSVTPGLSESDALPEAAALNPRQTRRTSAP